MRGALRGVGQALELRAMRYGCAADVAGAGEVCGGVIGPRYVGSGNSYGNCVTMGRVAGQSAAGVARA